MIHSQGERSNETAPQHTSITGRSRRRMLREKTRERQKTYTRKAGQLDQPMREYHRSPLLPHSCMGGDTFLCNRQHWKTHTRRLEFSQGFMNGTTAYPLTLCWLADWARLPPSVLSAFCVQLGQEPQRREVGEASEACQKNITHTKLF